MADKGMFDPSNTYMIDNVPFVYKRPFDSNEGETILSEGPTRSELQILVSKNSLLCKLRNMFFMVSKIFTQLFLIQYLNIHKQYNC